MAATEWSAAEKAAVAERFNKIEDRQDKREERLRAVEIDNAKLRTMIRVWATAAAGAATGAATLLAS